MLSSSSLSSSSSASPSSTTLSSLETSNNLRVALQYISLRKNERLDARQVTPIRCRIHGGPAVPVRADQCTPKHDPALPPHSNPPNGPSIAIQITHVLHFCTSTLCEASSSWTQSKCPFHAAIHNADAPACFSFLLNSLSLLQALASAPAASRTFSVDT